MAQYLYQTTVFKDTTNVLDLNIVQNDIDKLDFETSYKNQVQSIQEILINEITIHSFNTYTDFVLKVPSWTSVQMIEKNNRYDLYLISSVLL